MLKSSLEEARHNYFLLLLLQATKAVIEKEAPGMSLAMLQGSLKITHMAMLSRYSNGCIVLMSKKQTNQK